MKTVIEPDYSGTVAKERYGWLDAIKAFAITFVVFHHFGFSDYFVVQQFYTHIMLPLFFASSGFVFSEKRIGKHKEFIKNKLFRLVLPFVLLSMTASGFGELYNVYLGKTTYIGFVKVVLYSVIINDRLWFVSTLFFAEILLYVVMYVFKKNEKALIISAVISLAVCYVLSIKNTTFFFHTDTVFIAYPVLVYGVFLRKYLINFKVKTKIISGVICLSAYIAVIILMRIITGKPFFVSVRSEYYPFFPANIFLIITGVYAVFSLFSLMKFPSVITDFGKNTLYIYAFHMPIGKYIVKIAWYLNPMLTTEFLKANTYTRMIYCALTVIIIPFTLLAAAFTDKFFPWMVGKKSSETNSVWLKIKKKKKIP